MAEELKEVEQKSSANSSLYLATIIAGLSVLGIGIIENIELTKSGISMETYEMKIFGRCHYVGKLIAVSSAWLLYDKMGPKRVLQITAFPFFTSCLVMAYCRTAYGFYAAKSLASYARITVILVICMYCFEVTDKRRRSRAIVIIGIMYYLGLIFGQLIELYIDDFVLASLIPAVLPVIYLTALSFMPESPVYLYMNGDLVQARCSLQWLRGSDCNLDSEIKEIEEQAHPRNYREITAIFKSLAKSVFYATYLLFFQLIFSRYANDLFKESVTYLGLNPRYIDVFTFILLGCSLTIFLTFINNVNIRRVLQIVLLVLMFCNLVAAVTFTTFDYAFIVTALTMTILSSIVGAITPLIIFELFTGIPKKMRAFTFCGAVIVLIDILINNFGFAQALNTFRATLLHFGIVIFTFGVVYAGIIKFLASQTIEKQLQNIDRRITNIQGESRV